MTTAPEALLEVKGLTVHFPVKGTLFQRQREFVHAVDGVDFTVRRGETLGLVGESGCGKAVDRARHPPALPPHGLGPYGSRARS